jgi:hypothetical protein
VQSIALMADGQPVDWEQPPAQAKKVAIAFQILNAQPVEIPFTDLDIAVQWSQYLQKEWLPAPQPQAAPTPGID